MFITLEGPEGSGKTSHLPDLADFLREDGWKVLTTREPGGTAIGDQVRQVLMRIDNTAMNPRAETLLFLAARAQLVDEVIRPALAEGSVVISDRYGDSTLAYQGYGHGNDLGIVRQMLAFATGGLTPDLTVLLDVDPAIGLRRKKTVGEWNRLDAYELEFHRRVRAGYLELVREDPARWVVLDASQPREMVQSALRQVILARLTPPSVNNRG
ncbi:dTMP kinase [bacterium]|nr:MAG: dTMP kinase [bacterium]